MVLDRFIFLNQDPTKVGLYIITTFVLSFIILVLNRLLIPLYNNYYVSFHTMVLFICVLRFEKETLEQVGKTFLPHTFVCYRISYSEVVS